MSDETFHMSIFPSETAFVDFSSQVGGWLHKTFGLALAYNISEVVKELKALDMHYQMPGFRLTFVGESSRGKSTLLNHLLDRYLLRVRAYPTTATITSIVAGQSEQMEVHFPDGRHELRPADISSWNDLIAQTRPDKSQTVFPQVFITLQHPWLQEFDLELVDTPGVGALNERRTVLLSENLSQSDAVVLVVNAAAALSLTEIAFLEQEVVRRHIPRIIVVVTKLDTIPLEEQESVLEVVQEKVAHISPLIPVLSSSRVNIDIPDAEKIKAIRAQIETLAVKSERRILRSRQVAETLLDILSQLIEVGQMAISTIQMDTIKLREALREQEKKQQLIQKHWNEIELRLDERRLLVDEELHQRLSAARDDLVATISLSRTDNPKEWWEKDLPLLLRRAFFSLARTEESYILGAVAADLQWLCDKVASVFGVQIDHIPRHRSTHTEIKAQLGNMNLTNVERLRIFSRVGSGAALVAYYMLFLNPIGAAIGGAISVTAEIIGEYALSEKAKKQQQRLLDEAARSIDLAMDEYARRLSEYLLSIYKEMLQNTQRAQSTLQAEKKTMLRMSLTTANDKPWQQLIDQASALRREITVALQRGE